MPSIAAKSPSHGSMRPAAGAWPCSRAYGADAGKHFPGPLRARDRPRRCRARLRRVGLLPAVGGALLEESRDGVARKWPGEQIALADVALQRPEAVGLLDVFDGLGAGFTAECLAAPDHCVYQSAGRRLRGDAVHER